METRLTTLIDELNDQGCLVVQGPDRPGLVATVSAAIARNGGNIMQNDQFTSVGEDATFYQRTVFHKEGFSGSMERMREDLATTLDPAGLEWKLIDRSAPKRMAILAPKSDHCLLELLWLQQRGELPVEIPMVISNHPDLREEVEYFGVPFHHIPSQGPDKSEAEARILELVDGAADFVVLARYMQILSEDFLRRIEIPVINIHHSFLPAFIGAGPYRKAWERGVKLIGATAHYVTPELDAGPIIEQDVTRVNHTYSPADLQERGAYVERAVLSRAVQAHAEDRVFRHGNHAIVF
jgi:formyltetrahydrofolate deformylase